VDENGWMWDVVNYVELSVLNFWDILRGDRVQVFGNDFPKSDSEELCIVKAFAECMLHRLCESASLTVRIIPHSQFKCFVIVHIVRLRTWKALSLVFYVSDGRRRS
jgi:hypothetical protein